MMSDGNISIIKRAVNEFFPECQLLLFGSRARKDHHTYSDYDLVVIIGHTMDVAEKWFYQAKIRKILAKQKIPVDIIIQSQSELEINKTRSGHIIRYAVEEGILI